ncbi:GAF and ANTAR domain-containing protein [Saccharopolyspora sp. CA-218241]|uniref:GAF and ANTAR domain-containing protein n=1 Tax=Saccharopolyspora sp. CA-218241 TaxID=3240027 RepID=UPI003D96E308
MPESDEYLAIALAHMSRDLLAQETVQGTLDSISAHAVDLVDGCEAAGIMVVHRKGRVETASATDDLVRISDETQAELGEGPCLDAAAHSTPAYRIADMAGEGHRWRHYAPRARDLGIGSMMGLLLYTDEDELGALDFYSSRPGAFTDRSERLGWVLASHAAVAFSSARSSAQLQSAIGTRQDIGEALGIIMERRKVPEEQAFALLRQASQHGNTKLRDIAQRVITTGEVPGID